jgi:hypothetical protein
MFMFSFVCSSFCKGVLLPPRLAHSAPWRATDLICLSSPAEGRELVSFCLSYCHALLVAHISLRDDGFVYCENQIKSKFFRSSREALLFEVSLSDIQSNRT